MELSGKRIKILYAIIFSFAILIAIFSTRYFSRASGEYLATGVLGQVGYVPGGVESFSTATPVNYCDNPDPNYGYILGRSNFSSSGWLNTAIDESHNRLFVSDLDRVLVYETDPLTGEPVDLFADYVLGQSNFYTCERTISQNRLHFPTTIAYDSNHNYLYVYDSGNYRVLVFDVATITNGENAINVLGQVDFNSGTAGGPSQSTFANSVNGMTFDSTTNRLFVADGSGVNFPLGGRILVFDVTTIINGENAINVLGQADFSSQIDIPSISTLSSSGGIDLDINNKVLFVTDPGSHRVLLFDINPLNISDGEDAMLVIGQTTFSANTSGLTNDKFNQPTGVSYDDNNERLFVADWINHRILSFDTSSGYGAMSNGPAADYVLGQTDFTSSVSSPVNEYHLKNPSSVQVDGAHNSIIVGDSGNNRVLFYALDLLENGLAANQVLGQTTVAYVFDEISSYIRGGINSNTLERKLFDIGFFEPLGITIDEIGQNMFVVDRSNNRIQVFGLDSNGVPTDNVADHNLISDQTSSLGRPYSPGFFGETPDFKSIVFDKKNQRFFVAYNFLGDDTLFGVTVYDYSSQNYDLDSFVSPNFNLGGGMVVPAVTQSQTSNVHGLAYDSDNERLFVADTNYSRVLVFNVDPLTVSEYENADYVIGQVDFESQVTTVSQTGLDNPKGVAYDSVRDYLFVADTDNSRILVYDVNPSTMTNTPSAFAVLGQVDFDTAGANISRSGMSTPTQLFYDEASQQLFVSDSALNRIQIFHTKTITNNMDAIAVIGQGNFTSSSSGTTQSSLNSPFGLYYNSTNPRLYVTDSGNNRVLMYDFVHLDSQQFSTGLVGASYNQALSSSGSQGAVSYGLFSGTLPNGLTIDSSGVHGTLASGSAGNYTFTVYAVDVVGSSSFYSNLQTFTMNVINNATGGGTTCTDSHASNFNEQSSCVYDPPIIEITLPTNLDTYTSTTPTVSISGTASDLDTITEITYTINGGAEIPVNGLGVWDIANLALLPGTNTIIVTAKNNHNLQTSDIITVIYSPTENCTTNPSLPGCTPVENCSTNSTLPGCTPTENCTTNPSLPGCTPVENCSTNSTLPGCTSQPRPACSDGLDNDNDGLIDSADPGCQNPSDTDENDPPPEIILPTDVCENITGVQNIVPDGYYSTSNICLPVPPIENTQPVDEPQLKNTITISLEKSLKSFAWIGAIVGAFSTVGSMFAGALSLSELATIPLRLWTLLMGAFGFRKKVKHWGTVFDSVTKQPLDPVYVSLLDSNGKEISTAITDIEGRYGFFVPAGSYRIVANKSNYIFPSKKLYGKNADEIYNELYFGDYFEIKTEGEVITKNIPLDQLNFDWNEYAKNDRNLVKRHYLQSRVVAFFLTLLFYGGFASSVFALYLQVNTFTVIAVIFYVLLFLLRIFVIKKPSYGMVSASGSPVPYGVVKIYYSNAENLFQKKVLDKYGRYYALAPKGEYYATIEQKNVDQSYSEIHKSDDFRNSHGVINRKIKI